MSQPFATSEPVERFTGWRRVLLVACAAGLLATALAAGLGWVLDGPAAAGSAAGGGIAVVLLSALTLLIVDLAERHAPSLTIIAFMLGFVVKLVLLGIVLSTVQAPDWVSAAWAGLTALAVVVVWQTAELMAFRRMRFTVTPHP